MTGRGPRLQLSQQALSMSMRALERDLGVVLLHRDRRGVALLPPGRRCTPTVCSCWRRRPRPSSGPGRPTGAAGAAADRPHPVRHRGRGHRGAAAAPAAPEASVQVIPVPPTDLSDRLWDRSIDLGLRRSPAAASGLAGRVVARHRLRVAVRPGTLSPSARPSPCATSPPRPWSYRPREIPPTPISCSRSAGAGVEPRHRVDPVQGTPPVTAVLGNDDVALVTDAPGSAVGGAVRVVELEPATTLPLLATWRRDSRCPARDAVVQALAG